MSLLVALTLAVLSESLRSAAAVFQGAQFRGQRGEGRILGLQRLLLRLDSVNRRVLLLHDRVEHDAEIDVVEAAECDWRTHRSISLAKCGPAAVSLPDNAGPPSAAKTGRARAVAASRVMTTGAATGPTRSTGSPAPRAAMPVWFRMLKRVRFADSSAMLASRMRLSAAFVLTTCDCARLMANGRRFSRIPTVFCTSPSVSMAPTTSAERRPARRDASAKLVVAETQRGACRPRRCCSAMMPSAAVASG